MFSLSVLAWLFGIYLQFSAFLQILNANRSFLGSWQSKFFTIVLYKTLMLQDSITLLIFCGFIEFVWYTRMCIHKHLALQKSVRIIYFLPIVNKPAVVLERKWKKFQSVFTRPIPNFKHLTFLIFRQYSNIDLYVSVWCLPICIMHNVQLTGAMCIAL